MRTAQAGALLLVLVLPLAGCGALGGTEATWIPQSLVSTDTTSLEIGVQRAACASGVTGELLDPIVRYETRRVVIQARVAPNGLGAADCQGNDVVTQTVELTEPLGERDLIDGLCLVEPYSSYSYCADGGIRWSVSGDTGIEETHTVRIDVRTWLVIDAVLDNATSDAIDTTDATTAQLLTRIRQAGWDAASTEPVVDDVGWPPDDTVLQIELIAGDRQVVVDLLEREGETEAADTFGNAWDA